MVELIAKNELLLKAQLKELEEAREAWGKTVRNSEPYKAAEMEIRICNARIKTTNEVIAAIHYHIQKGYFPPGFGENV